MSLREQEEAVARIIDPEAWEEFSTSPITSLSKIRADSLSKARQIISLTDRILSIPQVSGGERGLTGKDAFMADITTSQHPQAGGERLTGGGELREAMQEACDLLAERKHGSQARSSGHNARLVLERALANPHRGEGEFRCYECSTDLVGPFCPACNPKIAAALASPPPVSGGELREGDVEWLEGVLDGLVDPYAISPHGDEYNARIDRIRAALSAPQPAVPGVSGELTPKALAEAIYQTHGGMTWTRRPDEAIAQPNGRKIDCVKVVAAISSMKGEK